VRRIFVLLVLGLIAAVPVYGDGKGTRSSSAAPPPQTAASEPSVDQILEKYVQALGGQSAIEKLKTRIMKGSIQVRGTGEMGTVQVFQKAPDKGFALINVPSDGPTPRGFNGKVGWYVDPDEGLQDATAEDVAAMKREFDFYRPIRLKTLYPKMVFKGKETVGDRQTYVIEATAQDGAVGKMYFDTQSGLLLRDEAPYVTEDGKGVLQIDYEDYREVDGVKLPFVWHEASPDFDHVIKFEEIRHNLPIEDSKFEKPSDN